RVGELQVAGARLQCRLAQRTQELELEAAGTPRVEVGRAQALAHDARQQQPLLVGALAARERARASARSGEAGRRLAERALPGDRPQRAAVADERLGDALVRVDRLIAEAPLVAQPPVVDAGVVAGQHAQGPLVAHGHGQVALRGAQRAHRARVLDLPGPRPEAI